MNRPERPDRKGSGRQGTGSPKQASFEQAVSAYYSSLTEDEIEEQAEWGEFAFRQFSREDCASWNLPEIERT